MINLSQAVGNKQSLTVGGEEYTFSPLGLSEIGYMQDWWCELPLEKCKRELDKFGSMYSEEQRAEMVETARKEYEERTRVRNGLEIDPEVVDRCGNSFNTEFSSPESLAKLVYLSLLENHPDITEKQAAKIVQIEGLVAMQDLLDTISFSQEDPDLDLLDGEPEEKKTTSRGFWNTIGGLWSKR